MPVWFWLPRKYKLSRSISCVRYAASPSAVALVAPVVLITTLSMWNPGVSVAYVGSPTWTIAPVPVYANAVPPVLPLACVPPRSAHPRNDTFRVPAVTTIWLAVVIVAHGSNTATFPVEIVRFDAMSGCP